MPCLRLQHFNSTYGLQHKPEPFSPGSRLDTANSKHRQKVLHSRKIDEGGWVLTLPDSSPEHRQTLCQLRFRVRIWILNEHNMMLLAYRQNIKNPIHFNFPKIKS